MHIIDILSDNRYLPIASAIDEGRIDAMISVVSLTELIKILGSHDIKKTQATIRDLKSSKIEIEPLDTTIAEQAGYLRLNYKIPTVDSLIGATGMVCNAKHILTDDTHFDALKYLIKPITMAKLTKMIRKIS